MSGLGNIPIIGGLFGGGPQQNIVPLDSGTSELLNSGVNRVANQTPGQLAGENNQAAQTAAKSFQQSPAQTSQQAAQTGSNPAMLQAIRNQYQGMAGKDTNQLMRQNQINAQFQHGQMLSDYARSALAQQQVQTQNYEQLSNAYQQNTMARGEMISSLIDLGTNTYAYGKTHPNSKLGQWMNGTNTGSGTFNSGDGGF
jgi:hypothetical protein